MSFANWLEILRRAEKKSIVSGNVRKVLYKFSDGNEMAEEYCLETGIVQRRAWHKKKELMGETDWEMELGETPRQLNQGGGGDAVSKLDFLVKESIEAPILSKRMTRQNIEWRIRNLPYPENVYQVTADKKKRAIIVRTTNKKYYKEINVPELDRCQLPPAQENISKHFQYNTLIITYKKPDLVCQMEAQVLMLLKEVPTENNMSDLLKGLLQK